MTEGHVGEAAAQEWVIRMRDPGFADWDAFTVWLEADRAHPPAYDAAVAADAWIGGLFADVPAGNARAPARQPANDVLPQPSRRRFVGGALAASVLIAGAASWFAIQPPAGVVYATSPGERRTVALADGSLVRMNGATRIETDGEREVILASGEALFEVRHDEDAPFVVRVGDNRLVDIGTIFNVVSENGSLDVSVSEGAVIVEDPRSRPARIRLDVGDAVSRVSADAPLVRRRQDPASVGSWRIGTLEYDDASLDRVAADLQRGIGRPVRSMGGDHRYSGTLRLDGTPDEVMARAGALIGVPVVRSGDGWTMGEHEAER